MAETNTTVLYEQLGVEKTATQDEIKKAWRKAALRLHPDRNPGDAQATTKFNMVKDAYDILSDPEKRDFYDKHGEEGLKLKEAMDNMDPSMVINAFAHSGMGVRLFMVAIVGSCCALGLLFPIFLVLRVDGTILWSWGAVCVPLFICVSSAICCSACAAVQGKPPTDDTARPAPVRCVTNSIPFLQCVMLLIFLSLMVTYLDDESEGKLDPPFPFAVACIPLFILEVLSLASMALGATKVQFDKAKQELGAGFPFETLGEWAAHSILLIALRFLQWVLLAVKIDGDRVAGSSGSSFSWCAVFIPLWILLAYLFLRLLLRYQRVRAAASAEKHAEGLKSATDEDEDTTKLDTPQAVMGQGCVLVLVLIVAVMLVSRLAGNEDLNMSSLAVCLIPLWIIASCGYCGFSCMVICFRAATGAGDWDGGDDGESAEEETGEGGGAGEAAPAPEAAPGAAAGAASPGGHVTIVVEAGGAGDLQAGLLEGQGRGAAAPSVAPERGSSPAPDKAKPGAVAAGGEGGEIVAARDESSIPISQPNLN